VKPGSLEAGDWAKTALPRRLRLTKPRTSTGRIGCDPANALSSLSIACDRDRARICLNSIRAFFELPPLKKLIQRETMEGFELRNNVDISVQTNSFRAPRGRPILLAVLDEVGFYRDENSSSPDTELCSLVPGTATLKWSDHRHLVAIHEIRPVI
jgi:hypothetical protein